MVALSDLLQTMQANRNTGEIRLRTDFGPATVWFSEGELLDASMGSFQGEAALFRLLGLTDGSFEVRTMPVNHERVIAEPVQVLLRRRNQRRSDWQSLVEKLPPLGTVLVLELQRFSAVSESLSEAQLAVIQLVDGRRAIFEIIDESGRDAVSVLREIEQLLEQGVIVPDDEGSNALGVESQDGQSGIVPQPTPVAPDVSGPPSVAIPLSTRLSGVRDEAAPLSTRGPPSQVRGGPMVGRYEVLSRLGRGGMGTVYLARITGEGGFRRLFAIKVLRSHLSASDEANQMLLKEARIASRIHHPNIVSVLDMGSHEGQPYLVMDYVTGCSLADLMRANSNRATVSALVSIILDTLAGLHATHTLKDDDGVALDVIHHDVSPHNILIGSDGIARLSDFGVAYVRRTIGEGEEPNRGKPAFTAPERVSGSPGDKRSDIFSVGVILWSGLTGVPLFETGDVESTLKNVLNKPVPPASRYSRSPESLDAICFRALQRSPAKRYQTAEEMLVALRKVAAAEDLLGSPTEVSQWVRHAMGKELDVQRLSFLDASRMAREAEASESIRMPSMDSVAGGERSRTIELVATESRRNTIAKWVAVVLAVGTVLLAFFLPDSLRKLGKVKPPPVDTTTMQSTPRPAADAGVR
jgi:eukaryotic-like serine/threonine-protein kinase